MQIIINHHPFRYEMENIVRMFFHALPLQVCENLQAPSGDYVLTVFSETEMTAEVSLNGQKLRRFAPLPADQMSQDSEWLLATLLYDCLCSFTGHGQKWGMLTGVRPTRLVHRMLDEGKSPAEIRQRFVETYRVDPEKFVLLYQTALAERPVIADSAPQDFSLYLSIPFCPTRCSYCSFVSQSVSRFGNLLEPYVAALGKEIEETARIARIAGLRLRSVYFGGGTPTTLSAEQLSFLMEKITRLFDFSAVREYTVEAGRPDTITSEKLHAIRDGGARRISINPQTFQQELLDRIGRRHTVSQTLEAFEIARRVGFDAVNMDLIAGLPGDRPEAFAASLEQALSLAPENITLHTLTLKRAADFSAAAQEIFRSGDSPAEQMVTGAQRRFSESGYHPYYLYRQKNSLSNLENVGYCRPGHEGIYNIYIMDEVHTILALGAGAVTKLCGGGEQRLQRIFNYKYPTEYLHGFDNIINRKREVLKFYEQHPV